MTSRAPGLVAAAACLAAAAGAARTWWAERAYSEGLQVTAAPDEDVPGRLAWYEEAVRRDPTEPVYGLRVGQIRLARAARADDPGDRGRELSLAIDSLRAAIAGAPLDGRAHAALAQALAAAGDSEAALRHADANLVLGPRRPRAYSWAIRYFLAVWDRTRDPRYLARALRAGKASADAVRDPPPDVPPVAVAPGIPELRRLLQSAAGPTADDVLRAIRGDRATIEFAADLCRPARAAVAARLLGESGADR